jgi:hypothetical protein
MRLGCGGEQQHLAVGVVGHCGDLRGVVEPDRGRRIRLPQAARFTQPNLRRLEVSQTHRDDRRLQLDERIRASSRAKGPVDHQSGFFELPELFVGEREVMEK